MVHGGDKSWEVFFPALGEYIVTPLQTMGLCIVGESEGQFFGVLWKFTLVYMLAVIMGITKALPKHEYDGIEHGSSDWATGEKYAILNKNKGIILAEKNYLPVDKRGNVNVLVVGRIWCW